MRRNLQIVMTTCVVGFGVWAGMFILTTIHGLIGDANPRLFDALSMIARVAGVLAGLGWGFRRVRAQHVNIPERSVFVFALLSLSYLFYLAVSGEVEDFLSVDPLVAARRVADRNNIHGDSIEFRGITIMGVRVYTVEKDGKVIQVIGVAPRLRLWWTPAFNMDRESYEKHDFGRPIIQGARLTPRSNRLFGARQSGVHESRPRGLEHPLSLGTCCCGCLSL
jgi:hypothetical protein